MARVSLFRVPAQCLLFALAVVGCGSGSESPTEVVPEPPPEVFGDNWDFRAEGFGDAAVITSCGTIFVCVDPDGLVYAMNGSLDLSATGASALLEIWGGCVNEVLVTLTGTRNGLTLDLSGTTAGYSVELSGALSADLQSFAGTYTLNGGQPCGSGHPPVTMTGQRVYPAGTWSDEEVTLSLTVASAPGTKGNFALSGPASFVNDACFPQGSISGTTRGRFVFAKASSGQNGRNQYVVTGEISQDGQSMRYAYAAINGSCRGVGSGTLTRN